MNETYPFSLSPALCGEYALFPYLNAPQLRSHYTAGFAAAVNRLNDLLRGEKCFQAHSLAQLCSVRHPVRADPRIRDAAADVLLHRLYFSTLSGERRAPSRALQGAIDRAFGSQKSLGNVLLRTEAEAVGDGETWLLAMPDGEVRLLRSSGCRLPFGTPLLVADGWAHAYAEQYGERKAEYLKGWWQVIDWDAVSQRYDRLLQNRPLYPAP